MFMTIVQPFVLGCRSCNVNTNANYIQRDLQTTSKQHFCNIATYNICHLKHVE